MYLYACVTVSVFVFEADGVGVSQTFLTVSAERLVPLNSSRSDASSAFSCGVTEMECENQLNAKIVINSMDTMWTVV